MAVKRPGVNGSGRSVVGCGDDSAWGKKHPLLVEFLTACSYEDGAERIPGSVVLFFEGGAFKGCLSDKTTGCVAFRSATTVLGVLFELEEGLSQAKLDWRPGRRPGPLPSPKRP